MENQLNDKTQKQIKQDQVLSQDQTQDQLNLHQRLKIIRSDTVVLNNFQHIIKNNRIWSMMKIQNDPSYFKRLIKIQQPQFLLIGCSDSRVPSNQIVGLQPGQLFVQRNIANIVSPSDINVLAVIQYSVQALKVKDIMIVGHYGCSGIKASFMKHDHGPLEAWLSIIRNIRAKNKNLLTGTQQQNEKLLVQLNVKQQVYNVARIPIVQKAWKQGQQLRIHGLVYKLQDGILKDLGLTLNKISQLPQQFRIIE